MAMDLAVRCASLVGVAFLGTFFWPLSPEGAAIYYVTVAGWPSPGVAGLAAAGQGLASVLLFGVGGQLRRRWAWFDRKCELARAKLAARLGRGAVRGQWALATTSGLFGLPPLSVTSALAPGLGVSFRLYFPVLFLARFARFVAVTTVILQLKAALAGR